MRFREDEKQVGFNNSLPPLPLIHLTSIPLSTRIDLKRQGRIDMLEQGQEDYLRELTKGFSAERLGRVYDDYENKTFEVLLVLAQKEKREKEEEEMEGNKRAAVVTTRRVGAGVRGRGPPTPSSSNGPVGRKNNRLSIRTLSEVYTKESLKADFNR